MAGLLFGTVVRDDADLWVLRRKVRLTGQLPVWNHEPFDVIVLDEFQDCTELLFWLIDCFILANQKANGGRAARLVVLGDERQSIYPFRGADQRYLTHAPEILGSLNSYPFAEVSLGQSFRLSEPTAVFVNNVFLGGEQCITSVKPGPKPIVLRCYPDDISALARAIYPMIRQYGAKNTAIIAPSIRNNKPLKKLINVLSKTYHIPIAVPTDDEGPLDDKVVAGKLCLSTFHGFKGSERDLVIVFDINFKYFSRNLPDDRCPNEVYVALTRAAKQLVIVHDEEKQLMPLVSVDALYETAEVRNMTKHQARIASPRAPSRFLKAGLAFPRRIGVRDMTRHMKDEPLYEIMKDELCIRQLAPPLPETEHIDIPNIILSDRERKFHEIVSDLNGLALMAAFEYRINREMKTFGLRQANIPETLPTRPEQLIPWLCRRACEYQADTSGYRPRFIQMAKHRFDWIPPREFDAAQKRLHEELGNAAKTLRFEVEAEKKVIVENQKTWLRGRADIAVSNSDDSASIEAIWELKFVSRISNEHAIQACTYAYLLASEYGKLPRIILFNVRDGEKWEITPRNGQEGLRRIIESVLRHKYTSTGETSLEEFTEICEKTLLEVRNLRVREDGDGKTLKVSAGKE